MNVDLERSWLKPEDLGAYPIPKALYGVAGYCILYPGSTTHRVRLARDKDKYLAGRGTTPDIWFSPKEEFENLFDDDLWIFEGEKKAACAVKAWKEMKGYIQNVVGIGGCWNAMKKKEGGGYMIGPDRLRILLSRGGRTVHVVLDGDVIENKHVGQAAQTLKNCIEDLGCTMILYRPEVGWKGFDDWIYQQPAASPATLEIVPFDKLEINRSLLYDTLGCHLNDKQGLILNELNGSKLLEHHFQAIGIVADKRLGYIEAASKRQVSPDLMHNKAVSYLQGDINPRYPYGSIGGAFGLYSIVSKATDLVQIFVKALQWDGVDRLETWGSEYFETSFPKLANEWGRLLFSGLVMRILEPGCKVDTVPILNGPQGIGKTTFFYELATIDGFVFYKSISDLPGSVGDDRTFKQGLVNSLVCDLGEGIIFESRKTSSDRLKQFITDQVDEYRVAYAKQNTIAPRGYIFVGTTNRGDQLSDYSGSRRFLYLNVKSIKRMAPLIRYQIMAEVVARFAAIKEEKWYDLRLTMDDMPQQLKDDNTHITNVQELMNVEHMRNDPAAEMLQMVIEGNEPAFLKDSGEYVLTISWTTARLNLSRPITNDYKVGRMLVDLNGSPQFPYTFEKVRKRATQIEFKAGQREVYTDYSTSQNPMMYVYIVRKK